MKKLTNLALSLLLALVMVAGALPGVMQTGHAAMSYDVYIDNGISNGVVSTDKPKTSGSGDTVTLTVTPGNGYKLKKLSVIQPDVLSSISDLVSLMGDAEFVANDGYSVKIDEGKFSVFHNDDKIASLDNSVNLINNLGSGGTYTTPLGNSEFWSFYIIGGKLRAIYFTNSSTEKNFSGTGANTISGTEIATTTVTEGTKYTFTAPASDVFVTAEFEMQDPKTVLIDVGKGHESLFTEKVLNDIKSEFVLTAVTKNGNIIKLEGVNPNTTEGYMEEEIQYYILYEVLDSVVHNGEQYYHVAYRPFSDYASEVDLVNDLYNDARYSTPVSNNLTYYLLWKKPYTKIEMDNGNPVCGKAANDAKPKLPEGIIITDTSWRDANDESVESFEAGKEYKFNGYLKIDEDGPLWRYFIYPSNFTLTVKGGKDVKYDFLEGYMVRVKFNVTADHDWDAGTVTKEPTETTEGVKTYKCKHCDATKTEVIPKKGSPVVANAPKVTTTAKTSARSMKVKWTMKWGQVSGAKKYTVAYRKVGSKKWTYKNTKKTKYVVKKHKMKGLYEYKVAAVSSNGTVWSDTNYRYFSKVKTKAKAGKGAVKVSWKKDKTATGYQVKIAGNKKMKNAETITLGAGSRSYKFSGLKSGKRYYVRVRPIKEHGGVTYTGILSKTFKMKVK